MHNKENQMAKAIIEQNPKRINLFTVSINGTRNTVKCDTNSNTILVYDYDEDIHIPLNWLGDHFTDGIGDKYTLDTISECYKDVLAAFAGTKVGKHIMRSSYTHQPSRDLLELYPQD
jgi:hypothetical protein